MGFVTTGVVLTLVLTRSDWTLLANGVWLATRLLSVAIVVLLVMTAYQIVGAVRSGWALRTNERAAVCCAIGATAVLTVNFAYWGLFVPGW